MMAMGVNWKKYVVGATDAWVDYFEAPAGAYAKLNHGTDPAKSLDDSIAAIEALLGN